MSAQTPIGENAELILYRNDEGNADVISLANGHDPEREIAWQAPDSSKDDFQWLASSAATFHKIKFSLVTD